jgi:dipeptidyl aminopeptidase/acylaminoacyl peptidase
LFFAALLLPLMPASIGAIAGNDGYQQPSQALVDIVDAKTTPILSLDPTRTVMALLEVPSLPTIEDLAQAELKLAGLRLSTATRGPSRSRYFSSVALQRLLDAAASQVNVEGLPEDARLENVSWSPDGRFLAFTHTSFDSSDSALGHIELWVTEAASGAARRLGGDLALTLTSFTPPRWLPDSSALVALATPADLPPAPRPRATPTGPTIEVSSGRKAPARTYQDLLKNSGDEQMFEHMLSSQLVEVDLAGSVRPLATPSLHWDLEVSPSGDYLLVETLHRPFSYRVPASRFPRRIQVLNRRGEVVFELADLPLKDQVPMAFGSVPTGPRDVEWRSDAPATLVWAEALDGGDAEAEADERDRLFQLAAPFDSSPEVMATLELRYAGTDWGNGQIAMVHEDWWQTRQTRSWQIAPDEPQADKRLLVDRSTEDRYSDPGRPLTRSNRHGHAVLDLVGDGDTIFLVGAGASPDGDRPFIDSQDLSSGETTRHLHSAPPFYEQPIEVLEVDEKGQPSLLLTLRESVDQPPNYFLRDLEAGSERQLTSFEHPTPQLRGISKELIRYQREDGVELTATLYLPPGFEAGDDPLPLLMWAYPIEYKSAAAASQVRGSPLRFDRISHWSPMIFLAAGYAVLDNPTMPIVGEGDAEPNDTYVEQLVKSARAAVEEVVRRGVADRERIAIGGHSYGAFMTANLLAHSDLFAAGIARSGAYNRTLTPFGFQAEQRSFWQAPEIYFAMSPFMHADKVNEPILLIHGEMDNNSGTFPMQSQRYFAALQGHGAVARLVMLPFESHGYRARESLLHMLHEQEAWLDRYVKKRSSESAASP